MNHRVMNYAFNVDEFETNWLLDYIDEFPSAQIDCIVNRLNHSALCFLTVAGNLALCIKQVSTYMCRPVCFVFERARASILFLLLGKRHLMRKL